MNKVQTTEAVLGMSKVWIVASLLLLLNANSLAQVLPYARSFAKTSKEEVETNLQELQAYAGQKLPTVEGFVAVGDKSLDQFERAYYQFTIELLPGSPSGTTVRISAKITAWYRDKDPAKSGYQVLPSNGRLELDLLDRLDESLGGKRNQGDPAAAGRQVVVAPKPKLDLSGIPGAGLILPKTSAATAGVETVNETGALRQQRETEEKRMRQLNTELQGLEEVKKGQAHPLNLVAVKRSGTPALAKPADGSRVLFHAVANDEFEFLEGAGEWIHVQISGASRGYIRRSSLELTDFILARVGAATGSAVASRAEKFRIVREESGMFPGSWEPLKGKTVKVYTVQPAAEETPAPGAAQRKLFALSLFRNLAVGTLGASEEGVVVIFDSSDGGIVAATRESLNQLADGNTETATFWKQCYLDPLDAFQVSAKL